MSRWFRHYAGMMRDEKLVRVAIKSQQPVERVLWIWGAILESASEIDNNGRYDLDPAEVAYFLRADEADVGAVLAALEDAGRVASSVVVHWGDRQYTSDRSRERQAAYRERKRKQIRHGDGGKDEGDGGVTSPDRHRDGEVTSPDRHRDGEVTPQETETETDNSVTNVTDGEAVSDPVKIMFDTGVSLIKSAGKSETAARSWLGKMRKDHGPEAVIVAIGAAKREGAIDPISFMEASLRARERQSAREWEFTGPC